MSLPEFIALRYQTLSRVPGFDPKGQAKRHLGLFYQALSQRLGWRKHWLLPARAQLAYCIDPKPWHGQPTTLAFIDRQVGDREALAFLKEALVHLKADLVGELYLEVAADDRDLLDLVLAAGFYVDSVLQVGDPRVCLKALEAKAGLTYGPKALALPEGVELKRFEPARHLDGVLALQASTFEAEPEFCFFGARPLHLQRVRQLLSAHPEGHHVLVSTQGEVLGHVGIDLERGDAFWGHLGGVELVLDQRLRGKGLIRPLYQRLLSELVAKGGTCLKGGTAQPGILKLGAEMGRPWLAWVVRDKGHFELSHFLRFAP